MEDETNVVEGTLLVIGHVVKVLIDLGSMYSFINPTYLQELRVKIEVLPFWFEVGTPTGKHALPTNKV